MSYDQKTFDSNSLPLSLNCHYIQYRELKAHTVVVIYPRIDLLH